MLVFDSDIYEKFFEILLRTEKVLRIATANIENIRVLIGDNVYAFSDVIKVLSKKNIETRIIASDPCIRKFPVYQELSSVNNVSFRFCYRMHSKLIIGDNKVAYLGSANITGAGVGIKSENKRNFEAGIIITKPQDILLLINYYDTIWNGNWCRECFYAQFRQQKYKRCEYDILPCPGIRAL
ncbi:MAG: phospholipase D-like domain-containing protein [Candidatus Korarchaeota archaeon]